jgi:hypothetical protein
MVQQELATAKGYARRAQHFIRSSASEPDPHVAAILLRTGKHFLRVAEGIERRVAADLGVPPPG